MPIDARPFLKLTTPGGSIKCGRVEVIPLALGLAAGPQGGATTDNPTHKVDVYVVFDAPPADLKEGVRVSIDGQNYTILRNGIQRDPGTWTLYLRAVKEAVRA